MCETINSELSLCTERTLAAHNTSSFTDYVYIDWNYYKCEVAVKTFINTQYTKNWF